MDLFTREDVKTLLAEHPSPCVSLFMPVHRGGSEEDPIRWRKHLAEAEEHLVKAGWRAAEVKELLAPARRLLEDIAFWKNQSDGLAAFLAPQFLRLFRLPLAFQDQVVVANRFSILPLLPLLSGNGKFFVLALSQNAVRLLHGTPHSRQVWGVFDPSTGRLERHEQALFGDVDLLDLAAAHTLAHGRTVYAVEPEQVPSGTDVAAIFCLPLPKHGKRP